MLHTPEYVSYFRFFRAAAFCFDDSTTHPWHLVCQPHQAVAWNAYPTVTKEFSKRCWALVSTLLSCSSQTVKCQQIWNNKTYSGLFHTFFCWPHKYVFFHCFDVFGVDLQWGKYKNENTLNEKVFYILLTGTVRVIWSTSVSKCISESERQNRVLD